MPHYANGEIARVYLLDVPYAIDHPYDYFIPRDLRATAVPGSFVAVPFGKSNRKQLALVTSLPAKTGFDELKPIGSSCAANFSLDEEMLALCLYLKEQTLCTIGDAVRCLVPPAALSKLVEYFRPATDKIGLSVGSLSPADLFVFDYIRTRTAQSGAVSLDALRAKFGAKVTASIAALREKELISSCSEVREAGAGKVVTIYTLALPQDEVRALMDAPKTTPKQKAVLELLLRAPEGMCAEEISAVSEAGRPQLRALTEKGILTATVRKADRNPYAVDTVANPSPIVLNEEQEAAYRTLSDLFGTGKAQAALLHGVTGSGKTSVMLRLIDEVRAKGRGVILLLPEIALTPQSLAIFCSRYGNDVAVIHSALSAGERLDSFRRIRGGEANVVVGTRSAVFAPVQNLGLLIIDEEQEHTYKSDQNPKYHARDVARWRCANNRALLLLASATPSLESYQRATEGRYQLIRLSKRYGNAALPKVTVVDMRKEAQGGNVTPLGTLLAREICETHARGEQSILFLNRRGYNHLVSCRACGEAIRCPSCSVAMNYHTKRGTYEDGELVCHWCGRRMQVPKVCPNCSSPHLVHVGYGTQRIEQELSELCPGARILRMDADTTATKFAHDRILSQFRQGEADILLGTQMVTKGHDFPGVTLVGVLLADASLYLDDYRANENTFSLLTQVIGRAGRGEKPGHAIIQTNNPDNEIIRMACEQNYEHFFASEIRLRKLLVFPPFCDIVLMTLTCSDEKALLLCTPLLPKEIIRAVHMEFSDVAVIVYGPFEAPVYRVDGKYRMRLVIKCRLNRRSRELFDYLLCWFGTDIKKPTLSIDFNPSGL